MSLVRPIDLNGMVQRTQDVTTIKHNQDDKPHQDQHNIQQTVHKEVDRHSKQVIHKDDAEHTEYKYDAKEKGNGQHFGQSQKRKKENPKKEKVVTRSDGHFDIKI